jgi:hypothetical protein
MTPRLIEIDGKLYPWSEIVALRRAQIAAASRAEQLALFEMIEGLASVVAAHRDRPLQRAAAVRTVTTAAVAADAALLHAPQTRRSILWPQTRPFC